MGTTWVACCRAGVVAPTPAKMTSGLRATNSLASLTTRARSPTLQRYSMCRLRPNSQPASCIPCKNAAMRACASGSFEGEWLSTPMRRTRSVCCARAARGQMTAAEPTTPLMKSRRLIAPPKAQDRASYSAKRADWKGDATTVDVRFTLDNDSESEFPHKAMSALLPKADMCGATRHVRYGPKADIALFIRSPRRRDFAPTAGR